MRATFLNKEQVARDTVVFRFAKPAGFSYTAGQSLDFRLIAPAYTDADGSVRTFSLVSSPHDDFIAFVTRVRGSAYKRSLMELQPGDEVELEGPFGSFFLHENMKRPAVFVIGGIGISPVYSIVRDAVHRTLPHTIAVLHSERTQEEAAYVDELRALSSAGALAYVPTMTREDGVWQGRQGHIDAKMLSEHALLDASPIFYLAGPSAMVAAMRTLLNESGVSNDDIRVEEFPGY